MYQVQGFWWYNEREMDILTALSGVKVRIDEKGARLYDGSRLPSSESVRGGTGRSAGDTW